MNIEKMREEFEAWIRVRSADTPMGFYPKLLHRCTLDEDIYRISWVDSAWEGWQASRELLAIELPEEVIKNAEKWKIVQRCMDMLQSDERNASIWSACSLLLISTAHKLNSALSTVLEEGVTIGEEKIGDWRVTVERVATDKEG